MVARGPTYREQVERTRHQDACPGALQVHQAADGGLARIRLPGGIISAAALAALADVTERLGSGTLELTTRGNLQVRGITDAGAVAEAVATAGLLPSATHERVRNIVSSPLSGRVGGVVDVRPWVAALDRAVRADADLARLPGRFLFSLDDGTADVSGLAADVGLHALEPERVAVLLAGRDTGVRVRPEDAVAAVIAVARSFLDIRENAWRVAELTDQSGLLTALPCVAETTGSPDTALAGPFPPAAPPVGWIGQDHPDTARVALGAVVPLGVLSARQARFLAAIDAPLVITPWRSLLVCDLTEGVADTALRVLAPLGLVFDARSPWLTVSACVGSPGCERSRADVRAEAARAAESGMRAVHYVGCERACGSPPSGNPPSGTVLVATGADYEPLHREPLHREPVHRPTVG